MALFCGYVVYMVQCRNKLQSFVIYVVYVVQYMNKCRVLWFIWFSTGTNSSFVFYVVYMVQYRNK